MTSTRYADVESTPVRHRPGLVLTDVRTPVLDGIQATRRLPRPASTAGVVMVTTIGLDRYAVDRHASQPDGLPLRWVRVEAG